MLYFVINLNVIFFYKSKSHILYKIQSRFFDLCVFVCVRVFSCALAVLFWLVYKFLTLIFFSFFSHNRIILKFCLLQDCFSIWGALRVIPSSFVLRSSWFLSWFFLYVQSHYRTVCKKGIALSTFSYKYIFF